MKAQQNKLILSIFSLLLSLPIAADAAKRIEMYRLSDGPQASQQDAIKAKTLPGKPIGTITAKQTRYGLLLVPNLRGLPPGIHGFHVHELGNCGDNGQAAGGHLDPKKTNKHGGPYDRDGHLGDLPVLFVDNDGNATTPILAPRLELADIHGHSLMIHAGGDNYRDQPKPLGGGGARLACGVASFILCE